MSAKPPGTEWLALRACADMPVAVFFPEDSHGVTRAKAICATCPVRLDCLQSAMDNDERFGIWGGTSEHERRRLRRPQTQAISVGAGFDRPAYMREYKRQARAVAADAAMPTTEYGRRLVALLMQAEVA